MAQFVLICVLSQISNLKEICSTGYLNVNYTSRPALVNACTIHSQMTQWAIRLQLLISPII